MSELTERCYLSEAARTLYPGGESELIEMRKLSQLRLLMGRYVVCTLSTGMLGFQKSLGVTRGSTLVRWWPI